MQRFGLRKTLLNGRLGNRIAGVFGQISLPPQCIQPDEDRPVHREGMHEALNGRLMVAWLARKSAKSPSMKTCIGQHANRGIRAAEPGFAAHLRYLRIGDMTGSTVEQTSYRLL